MAKQKTAGLKPRRTLQGFVLAGLFGWIASFPVAAEETINIGVQQAMMPIFIAKASGGLGKIESKHGVRFVFHTYAYGGPENKALASGELQMASAGMGPAISAASRLPVKLLAITILEQTVLLVPVDSPIKTVADLRGKTIVHPGTGSQQYPLLIKGLKDAGLAAKDVTLFKVIVGRDKYQFDVWGDTVNIASRMAGAGSPGVVAMTYDAWMQVESDCEGRSLSRMEIKGKGAVEVIGCTGVR